MVQPNFFIAGAPKAGTTSLYNYLDQHPQIYMSPVKEPCYFAPEIRPDNFTEDVQPLIRRVSEDLQKYLHGPMTGKHFGGLVSSRDDYLRLFSNVKEEIAIGEASVVYLWSRSAAANIASAIPDARIIMVLRSPVDRLYSQYLHMLTTGMVRLPFGDCVETSRCADTSRLGKYHPFLELGLYYEQVKRFLDIFPRERVRIYLYDDYRLDTLGTLRDVFGFLSVDVNFVPDISQRYLEPRVPKLIGASYLLKRYGLWSRAIELIPSAFRAPVRRMALRSRKSLGMTETERAWLTEYYREDVQKLSDLLKRDLSAWL